MSRRLPELEVPNPSGSCWTCLEHEGHESCDGTLPRCNICEDNQRVCKGYRVRYAWPNGEKNSGRTLIHPQGALVAAITAFGLPETESRLIKHYAQNIARLSVAIDYDGNGFRRVVAIALNEPALLNALLAISEAHLSRWQRKTDKTSRGYFRKSVHCLQERLKGPEMAKSETTLIVMLVLLIYELCDGTSDAWKCHYDAILAWLRSRRDCSGVDPCFLSMIMMLAAQLVMQTNDGYRDTSYQLLNHVLRPQQGATQVDVFHGCTVALPRLMVTAAQLYDEAAKLRGLRPSDARAPMEDIHARVTALQSQIKATRIDPYEASQLDLQFGLLVHSQHSSASGNLTLTDVLHEQETRSAARCTAEVFRLALHVYVARILHDPLIATTTDASETRPWVVEALDLVPQIPDAGDGPGNFLGWALVVVGAELDALEERSYVRARLESLARLALNQGNAGLRVLDEVWRRRDAVRRGEAAYRRCRWQEVMTAMGIDMALM